jgi:hypothetical protein
VSYHSSNGLFPKIETVSMHLAKHRERDRYNTIQHYFLEQVNNSKRVKKNKYNILFISRVNLIMMLAAGRLKFNRVKHR